MKRLAALLSLVATVSIAAIVVAQPPGGPGRDRRDGPQTVDVSASVERMMKFDADGDGKLSKAEITDSRLSALFERADANQDGSVTKEELTATLQKETAASGSRGPGGGFPGGPGDGFGGPGGPPGGPGGPGMGGPPPIGEVLPRRVQEMLELTEAQRQKVDELQKEVDGKLAKILSDSQKIQWDEMRRRGPGGFGPPGGGPDGPGGRGGRGAGPRNGPPGEGGRPQRPGNN